jgi:hypothetical protein
LQIRGGFVKEVEIRQRSREPKMLQNSAAVVAAMSPTSALKDARQQRQRQGRARTTNSVTYLPKQPLTPRALDRRRKDLVMAFVNALGGEQVCSDLTLVAVRRAAELQAMCEQARAAQLNGQPVDMLALVRLEGVAARAIRQLGIRIEPPPAKARGLELARQRWAEAEAKKAEKAKTAGEATHTTEGPPDGCE